MKNSEEVLSLIRSKNRCLERLMIVTKEVLSLEHDQILMKDAASKISPLDLYDRERASVTKAIELFDGKISEIIATFTPEDKKGALIDEMKVEMKKSEMLLDAIFNADDIVFERIAELQRTVTTQLIENRKSRELLQKFSSPRPSEAGEEVDTVL